jgi:hypothetical protein
MTVFIDGLCQGVNDGSGCQTQSMIFHRNGPWSGPRSCQPAGICHGVQETQALEHCMAYRCVLGMQVWVHDGLGVWQAARRFNTGQCVQGSARQSSRLPVKAAQSSALALDLPWYPHHVRTIVASTEFEERGTMIGE